MSTAKFFQGFRITKYDNESTCYVYFYENMNQTRSNNLEMGFNYAKKKFNITEDNYVSHKEEGKTVYTRK